MGSNAGFASAYGAVRAVLPAEEFVRFIAAASVVVSHGGAGTLLEVIRVGKVPVVMPGRRRYGTGA